MNIEEAPEGSIRTNSGIYINIFEPTEDMIIIEDIAHALSRLPRFGGHLNRHYSVAQHSLECSYFGNDIEEQLELLLHDASEAYMLDMPSPIKKMLPDYRYYENNLMTVIFNKFGLIYPLSENVKRIDAHMLNVEWENLVLKDNPNFHCLEMDLVKNDFLYRFNTLINKRNDKKIIFSNN